MEIDPLERRNPLKIRVDVLPSYEVESASMSHGKRRSRSVTCAVADSGNKDKIASNQMGLCRRLSGVILRSDLAANIGFEFNFVIVE